MPYPTTTGWYGGYMLRWTRLPPAQDRRRAMIAYNYAMRTHAVHFRGQSAGIVLEISIEHA
jgi:hypothetical protein